jgi:hypothetical protein
MLRPGEPPTISPQREAERLRLSEYERAILQAIERELGWPLTEPEEHLALEQARALGMVYAGNDLFLAALARPKFLPHGPHFDQQSRLRRGRRHAAARLDGLRTGGHREGRTPCLAGEDRRRPPQGHARAGESYSDVILRLIALEASIR